MMQQSPKTNSFLLKWRGDALTVTLHLDTPRKGRAALRTNLGNASIRRREIIDHTERGVIPLAKAWTDIPMPETEPGVFSVTVPLKEVGIFSAKACFFPEHSATPEWPEGENFHIKVEPANTRRNNSMYTVFTRQFGPARHTNPRTPDVMQMETELDKRGYAVIPPSGTFRDVIHQLGHIMDTMHFRIVQLLPIHPVPTTFARMGRFGSAFAARDFLSVDPALAEFDTYATPLDQFKELIDAVHHRGGVLFIDLPANHTGWAATLQEHHPEWYHRRSDGEFVSPGAWGVTWADLVELDYTSPELRAYMADVFLYWCRQGVDGFRCDAGYMIPESTWTYIIARVREEYPDTIFMLEGLGGKLETTDALLSRADMNWAYSEIFQTDTRGAFDWYLPGAIERAERCGPLIHFAETHDNARLAAKGETYARMRVALAALLSHQGAWGIANGVEWFATEKIDVHGASALNWDAPSNQVAWIARINDLLSSHPAFGPHTHVRVINTAPGETLAIVRECPDPTHNILVLINLDCEHSQTVYWNAEAFPNTQAFDLLSDRRATFDASNGYLLEKGQVCCFATHPATSTIIDETPFVATLPYTRWTFPADTHRDVMIPYGHALSVRAEHAFRVRLRRGNTTVAVCRATPIGSNDFRAWITTPNYAGDGTRTERLALDIAVYAPSGTLRSTSTVLLLPRGEDARVQTLIEASEIRHTERLYATLSNGAGAMASVPLAWSDIRSQYDALLAVNTDPHVPCDKMIFWSRARIWLQYQGYSHALNKDCCTHVQTDPAGHFTTWFFHVPAGMGKMVPLSLTLTLDDDINCARLSVARLGIEPSLDVKDEIRIIVRPDIEWRNFHQTTKAFLGAEQQFPAAIHARANGYEFRPVDDSLILSMTTTCGAFHQETEWTYMIPHPEEAERGLDSCGDLFSPGWFELPLRPHGAATLIAGLNLPTDHSATPPRTTPSISATLPVVDAASRALELYVVRRDAFKTVIAGYPWFLDWGRDTLIVLRGLIADGRYEESLAILTEFARFEQNGTIPNMIHGNDAANRETTDAPLWLIVAAGDLMAALGEKKVLTTACGGRTVHDILISIVEHYLSGTPNGIHADPASGLIYSPAHYTWMDTNYPAATPREGYPVEIQALWISALRLLARTIDKKWNALAEQATTSLLAYFPVAEGWLADCLRAGPHTPAAEAIQEDALRGNQLFVSALGIPLPIATQTAILKACETLLVPGGIRSVADRSTTCDMAVYRDGALLNNPHYPYQGTYTGDEDTRRKVAYHNGTVWNWPFPVYVEALYRLHGDKHRATCLSLLASSIDAFNTGCIGHLPEICDGNAPHTQKGCRAQAWSVSELLRVWKLLTKEPAHRTKKQTTSATKKTTARRRQSHE